MTNQATRVAMKFRVSTVSQRVDGTSLDTQEQRTRAYATDRGYEVVEAFVFSENHTGTDLNCPAMRRLKQAAIAGQFDVLLFHSFDRFHRPENEGDEWKALEMMAFFKEHGVAIEFVDGSVPVSGAYASLFSLLEGMKAGDYRRKMLEATKRGTVARVKEGKFTSRPPFGYCKDTDGRLAIDEDQAKVVRKIVEMYLQERIGVRKIQVRLTGTYLSPSGNTRWHQSVISRILRSEFYWSSRHPLGATMGIVGGVPCPPIISEDQGKKILTRLDGNKRVKKSSKSSTILQGRVRCQCGGNWKFQTARKGKTKAEYFCRERYSDGPRVLAGMERCSVPRRGQNDLELAVVVEIFEALKSPDNLAATVEVSLKNAEERIKTSGVEVAPLQQAVEEIEVRLASVDRVRINGRLSEAELDAKEKELLQTKTDLERRLTELDPEKIAELEEARAMLPMISHLLSWAETYNKPTPVTDMGAIKSFTSTSLPLVEQVVVEMLALFPPEWFIGEPGKFDDDDWLVTALNEFLDRLHARITMYDDHAELEGVLPLSIPFGPDDMPKNSLHATHLPRELEGGRIGDSQVAYRRARLSQANADCHVAYLKNPTSSLM